MRVAVIVATPGEAGVLEDLAKAHFGLPVFVSGVGAVNAALTAAEVIDEARPDLIVSAGIGGAYPSSGLRPGDVAVSSDIVYGGLGAMDGARFLDLAELGFALQDREDRVYNSLPVWQGARAWAARAGAVFGPTVTLETVTGDDEVARELERRVPGALTEGMEGAGVAHAALRAGVPCAEVRGVSNFVGRRDRAAWQIREALAACRAALLALRMNGAREL